jgi:1-aminocyclopropane-1-carboxylate deaminase/D-cysteine desulfhydrase-like pyridoxal-dependent ACC family enzyme
LTAPPTAADSSDEESPDRAAPAPEEVVRLVPQLNFEDWPFELLEVDLWTKKQKDNWGRMDGEMAEAIKKEAQKGGTKFRIVYGKTKKWTYEIDFMKWTQLNVGTGTERRMRFGVL